MINKSLDICRDADHYADSDVIALYHAAEDVAHVLDSFIAYVNVAYRDDVADDLMKALGIDYDRWREDRESSYS